MSTFDSVRFRQAKRLWERAAKVVQKDRHFISFEHFLESVPRVPRWAPEIEDRYPMLVYMANKGDVFDLAEAAGIHVSEPHRMQYLRDDALPVDGWFRVRLEHGTRTRALPEVRAGLPADESVLDYFAGFHLHFQYPTLVRDTGLHLPGNYCGSKKRTCLLHLVSGQLRYNWGITAAGVLKDFVLPVRTTAPPIG